MITKEETKELFQRVERNDMQAREVLVENNMNLVNYEVYRKFRNYYNQEDIISVGYIGLLKAVDNFDIERDICFSSYAIKVIDNEIFMFINKEKRKTTLSLDEELTYENEDTTMTLMDLVADDYDMEEDYCQNEMYQAIKLLVNNLPDKKREIIKLYYGFYGRTYNQIEIAKIYSCSQPYIARVIGVTTEYIAKELRMRDFIDLGRGKIKAKRNTTTIYELLEDYLPEQVDTVINYLSDKEKEIITLRYGDFKRGIIPRKLNKEEKKRFDNTLKKIRKMLFDMKTYGQIKLVRKK